MYISLNFTYSHVSEKHWLKSLADKFCNWLWDKYLQKEFDKKTNTHMLFTGREVRIGKIFARGLEYGPKPQAEGRTRDIGHSFSQYVPTKAGE